MEAMTVNLKKRKLSVEEDLFKLRSQLEVKEEELQSIKAALGKTPPSTSAASGHKAWSNHRSMVHWSIGPWSTVFDLPRGNWSYESAQKTSPWVS